MIAQLVFDYKTVAKEKVWMKSDMNLVYSCNLSFLSYSLFLN